MEHADRAEQEQQQQDRARRPAGSGSGSWAGRAFDALKARWEAQGVQRGIATALIATFFVSLAAIEASRQGWLPGELGERIPSKHYYAVYLVFYLLVIVELVGLIFGLARSVANALGKQFEILSLILLRQAFESLAEFEEPVDWDGLTRPLAESPVLHLISDGVGALLIFVLLGFYYRCQRHQPISEDARERAAFVEAKKGIALGLFVAVAGIGVINGRALFWGGDSFPFFEAIYTLLIFSDVLIVLVSLRFSTTYRVVFRNSGFALATVLIRLALTAPPFWNVLIGLTAGGFALGLTLAYNAFAPILRQKSSEPDDADTQEREGGDRAAHPPPADDRKPSVSSR